MLSSHAPIVQAMPVNRLKRVFQTYGLRDGLYYLVGRALSRITCNKIRLIRHKIVAQPIPIDTTLPVGRENGCMVKPAGATDPLVSQFPREDAVIDRRFKHGARCIAAHYGNTLAGHIWIAKESYYEDELRCCYRLSSPSDSVWDFDVYVAPAYRLGRTFFRLWQGTSGILSEQGIRWSFSRIDIDNTKSIRAHERLGAVELFRVTFVCAGPFQLTFAPAAGVIHAGLGRNSVPVIDITPPQLGCRR